MSSEKRGPEVIAFRRCPVRLRPDYIHIPHIEGLKEHSHQSLFLIIVTGGQPELFSKYSASRSKGECMVRGRAVASWFVTLLRMHMHAGSSPARGTVRTGHLANLFTLSFFVLSRQCLKMRVPGVNRYPTNVPVREHQFLSGPGRH